MRANRRTSLYQRFNPGVVPPEETDDTALWFLFQGSRMVLCRSGKQLRVPDKRFLSEIGQEVTGQHYLGQLDRRACFCAQLHAPLDVEDVELLSLRSAFAGLDDALFALAGRAFQILEWDRTHQFCGRCGSRTVEENGERAKRCPRCDLVSYPTLSPAVIVAVRRGN
ncbi:MAG: NADH pyrophosphatase, partial [Calditrichaeota bacterium]